MVCAGAPGAARPRQPTHWAAARLPQPPPLPAHPTAPPPRLPLAPACDGRPQIKYQKVIDAMYAGIKKVDDAKAAKAKD